MGLPSLRQLYNQVEQVATPLVNGISHSEEFAQVAATVGGARRLVRDEVDKLAARAWHVVNLPAGTDVQRLKVQLGALDREIRLLAMEIERSRAEGKD